MTNWNDTYEDDEDMNWDFEDEEWEDEEWEDEENMNWDSGINPPRQTGGWDIDNFEERVTERINPFNGMRESIVQRVLRRGHVPTAQTPREVKFEEIDTTLNDYLSRLGIK